MLVVFAAQVVNDSLVVGGVRIAVEVKEEVAVGVRAKDASVDVDEKGEEVSADARGGLLQQVRVPENDGATVRGEGWPAHLAEESEAARSCADG